jgi:preprotein translocase subunit SecD
MARQRWLLGLIISLTAAALFLLLNPILKSGTSPFRLGLDLQGGSQITLQVKPSDTIKDISSPEGQKAVGDVERVIADRVNRLGVSEPLVQRVGNDKILVQLAGIKDPYEAESLLGRAAQLEFREQKAGTEDKFQALFNQYRPLINQEAALRKQIKELKKSEDRAALAALSVEIKKVSQKSFTDLFNKTGIDGRNLKEAFAQPIGSAGDDWQVDIRFDADGGSKFADMTKRLAGTGRSIGVFLDDTLISAPNVGIEFAQNGITGGGASISRFTLDTANELAIQFKSGSLPVPIEIAENRVVGASLGQDSVERSVYAGLGGIFLVLVFMVLYYRLPGAIASVALVIYTVLNLAAFVLLPGFVLTLPGIAGFILSVGMAVDANVLIFERTREEIRDGKTLYQSVKGGFTNAFSSILDSNITTIIACAALYWLGTGLVRGFAVTLTMGVLISMFTALTCSRTLLFYVLSFPALRKPEFFCPNPPAITTNQSSEIV